MGAMFVARAEGCKLTPGAAKLGRESGAIHGEGTGGICLCGNRRRRSRNLATGAGRCSRKCARSFTQADPEIVEEWKWVNRGTPVLSHGGIVCTGETYKNVVKMTFAKGAALKDPEGLFNSSLEGNVRRAIDIHEGDKIDEAALKDLIRAAVALNLESKKAKAKPRPATRRSA